MYIFAKSRSFRLRPKIRLYDLQECEANLIFHFYSFELRVFGIFNFIFLYTIYINMLVCVQFGDSTKFMNPGDDAYRLCTRRAIAKVDSALKGGNGNDKRN